MLSISNLKLSFKIAFLDKLLFIFLISEYDKPTIDWYTFFHWFSLICEVFTKSERSPIICFISGKPGHGIAMTAWNLRHMALSSNSWWLVSDLRILTFNRIRHFIPCIVFFRKSPCMSKFILFQNSIIRNSYFWTKWRICQNHIYCPEKIHDFYIPYTIFPASFD